MLGTGPPQQTEEAAEKDPQPRDLQNSRIKELHKQKPSPGCARGFQGLPVVNKPPYTKACRRLEKKKDRFLGIPRGERNLECSSSALSSDLGVEQKVQD